MRARRNALTDDSSRRADTAPLPIHRHTPIPLNQHSPAIQRGDQIPQEQHVPTRLCEQTPAGCVFHPRLATRSRTPPFPTCSGSVTRPAHRQGPSTSHVPRHVPAHPCAQSPHTWSALRASNPITCADDASNKCASSTTGNVEPVTRDRTSDTSRLVATSEPSSPDVLHRPAQAAKGIPHAEAVARTSSTAQTIRTGPLHR